MTDIVRPVLRLFTYARAQHRLRQAGKPAGFASAAKLVAGETGVALDDVNTVLDCGFSSVETQERVAAWCGLRRATKHGTPVLIADPAHDFEPGSVCPDGGAVPVSPEEAKRRVETRLAQRGAM